MLLLKWIASTVGEPTDPFTAWDTTTMDRTILSANGASGGRFRTTEEFRVLLTGGGITLATIIPIASQVSVFDAHPAHS